VPWTDVQFDDGVLTITDTASPPGLALAGEMDESHYTALTEALDELSKSREVHLDLSGLHYCDVTCLRAMVRLAYPQGSDPHTPDVVVHDAPHFVRTALRIVGWDRLPGLSLREGTQKS
jgi:ABC-type transporter Mla MlaB component